MDDQAVSPGEIAEIDFGRLGLVPSPDDPSKKCVVHALVVTLVHSRHQYVHITRTQKLPDLVNRLEDAWEFFGGVTKLVVVDNLKAAVIKADRYDPIFNRTFEEYAAYRGFCIDATRSVSPKDKPKVERQVQFVRSNFFRGETWLNIPQVQREAVAWCFGRAGMREHGTTRLRPLEVFESQEKSALLELTGERYDPPIWKKCKVHPDQHVRVDYALYSVPHDLTGKQVDVRLDTALVRIFFKGELVKTHARVPQGKRQTDLSDYPKELTPYTTREPRVRIERARVIGPATEAFVEELRKRSTNTPLLQDSEVYLHPTVFSRKSTSS
jgi:hypothetical protein